MLYRILILIRGAARAIHWKKLGCENGQPSNPQPDRTSLAASTGSAASAIRRFKYVKQTQLWTLGYPNAAHGPNNFLLIASFSWKMNEKHYLCTYWITGPGPKARTKGPRPKGQDQRVWTKGPEPMVSISYRYLIDILSISNRYRIDIQSISYRYRIDIDSISDILSIYNDIVSISHRYPVDIPSISYRYRYRTDIVSISYRYRIDIVSIWARSFTLLVETWDGRR